MLAPPPPAVMGRNGVCAGRHHPSCRGPTAWGSSQSIVSLHRFPAAPRGLRHSPRFQTLGGSRTLLIALPNASSALGARFNSATTVPSWSAWRPESHSNAATSSPPAGEFARVPMRLDAPSAPRLEAAVRRRDARITRAKWFRCHYGLVNADRQLACTLAEEGGRVLNSDNPRSILLRLDFHGASQYRTLRRPCRRLPPRLDARSEG